MLHLLEFEMLAPMEVNRHFKADWRMIGQEFGRIGLYSLPVEQLICWLDLFLQHYQTGLTISSKLRASLEALQLEPGYRGNPLLENFSTLGCLATDSWLVAVWERLLATTSPSTLITRSFCFPTHTTWNSCKRLWNGGKRAMHS